jgi:HEAT repeat protein
MNLEAFDYDLDERHALLLQRIDDITSEIYSIGAYEERKAIFDHLRKLIQDKDVAGDMIAVEVLCWTLDQLASEG